jgi:hypothetical protein
MTSSIGLASWQLDRFVSADGLTRDAQLTTVPVIYSGERLELNSRGTLQVEILDAGGRPLTSKSKPVKGDNLRHSVRWDHGSPAAYQGKPVMLRFHMAGGELYSFAFRQA